MRIAGPETNLGVCEVLLVLIHCTIKTSPAVCPLRRGAVRHRVGGDCYQPEHRHQSIGLATLTATLAVATPNRQGKGLPTGSESNDC